MQALHPQATPVPELFRSAEEAWFWSHNVKDVVRHIPRPCVPFDIFKIIERMVRQRHLTLDHIHVMRFYAARGRRPNPRWRQEQRAHFLWVEAMRRLHDAFEKHGLVQNRFKRVLIDLSLERAMKEQDS